MLGKGVKVPTERRLRGLAALAAIGLVAVACTPRTSGERNAARPANEPTAAPEAISGPFFLDTKTGERTPLAKNLDGGFSYVASPDGTQLLYGTCCSGADVLTVADIDGTDAHTVESPEGLNYYGARWSPDGTKLVYQERDGGADDALTGDVGNLFVHDLSTGRRTQITDLELSRAWWYFLAPSFSPDGRNVVFHLPRSRSETTKFDVWSVSVTGGEPTLLLRNASFPMLNPLGPLAVDAERIAFVSPWPDDFAGDSIMAGRPVPGSDFRHKLVEANHSIGFPTVSPDGSNIAYLDGSSIYVVELVTPPKPGGGEPSKVAVGNTAEWLDNDTLIVAP